MTREQKGGEKGGQEWRKEGWREEEKRRRG